MKYLGLIVVILFAASCCGNKSIAQNMPEAASTDAVTTVDENSNADIADAGDVSEARQNDITASKPDLSESDSNPKNEVEPYQEAFDHSAWTKLLKKYVTNSGNVDYKGFKQDRTALSAYIAALGQNEPTDTWRPEDKLAYWINAYNALTVDLIIRNYPLKSIKDIKNPWKQRLWKLGEKWYDLDEIEHQILRKMNEPRIHFGIVCASYSCPKLLNEAFTANELESQLTRATKEFLADQNRNVISENDLELSKIFQWFAKDFKQNGTLIDFLNQYSDVKISSNAKKRFKDYNWDLNE